MTTLVKKQHYVWQYMLQPWTTDGKIACLRQAENKAFVTGTTSVANETFFYLSSALTPQDMAYIETIIMRSRHELLRQENRRTAAMFQLSHQLRGSLQGVPESDPRRIEAENQLAVIDKTLGESYQTLFEQRATHLVDSLRASNCDFYRDSKQALEFINFISHQFTRSPKLLDIASRIPNPIQGLDLKRTWLVETHIYATNIAFSLFAEKEKYKFLFLRNNTDVSFITGDVPLINLNEQTIDDVRMYYPLSPTHAVIYGVNPSIDFCRTQEIDRDQAAFLNDRIYYMSVDQIYGASKSQVEAYMGKAKQAHVASPI